MLLHGGPRRVLFEEAVNVVVAKTFVDMEARSFTHQSGAMRIRASKSVNWGHAIVAQNAVQNHELALVERYFGDSSSWRVCRRNITQTGCRHLSRRLRMIK